MIIITILLYMLLGILTYTLIIPLCEALGSYLCQWFELQRSKLVVKQTRCKKEISDIEEGEQKHHINVIGFQTTSSSDEEEDEEEEEEYE